ncbi:MAG: hypothetical protein NVS3B20_26950 [Polyangiales bacterium]
MQPTKSLASAPTNRLTAGDERGGFEAIAEKGRHLLVVRLWGHWDEAIARQFVAAVESLGADLSRKSWGSLVDSRRFMVQSPAIQELRQESVQRAVVLGCTKMAVLVTSAVYKLQFKRMSRIANVHTEFFVDEKAALAWLEAKPKPKL